MYYLWLIPISFAFHFAETWFIWKNKTVGGLWFLPAILFNCFPLWLLLSKHSKDLMFDGMIFDLMIFSACALAAGYFTGKMVTFNSIQWVGLAMVVLGLFLVKYEW